MTDNNTILLKEIIDLLKDLIRQTENNRRSASANNSQIASIMNKNNAIEI